MPLVRRETRINENQQLKIISFPGRGATHTSTTVQPSETTSPGQSGESIEETSTGVFRNNLNNF